MNVLKMGSSRQNWPLTIMNILSDDGRGGADRLALDISKGLRRRGHRMIFGVPSSFFLMEEAREAGIEIFDLYPSGARDMEVVPDLVNFCRKENVRILNAHQSFGRRMLLLSKLRGTDAKIVFTRHCIMSTLPYLGAFHTNFLVDMNLAVSETVRRSLLRAGIFPGKAVTVYGGIDMNKFVNAPPEKVEDLKKRYTRTGVFNIGIVARFSREKNFRPDMRTMKGHEFLFRALSRLSSGLNFNFNVLALGVCGEENAKGLKLVAEYNGLPREVVTVCDFQHDIAPFYRLMDLNVLPSSNEGLGLALIEAMASGVPSIGADSGGIREIIAGGEDGFLFRPGDSAGLAEKIRILHEDKNLRDLFAGRGSEKVKKLFDIENSVSATEDVFYALLN